MYGGKIFSRILHVPDEWREREAVVLNCSYVNDLKGTVLHRTVPRRLKPRPIGSVEGGHRPPIFHVSIT